VETNVTEEIQRNEHNFLGTVPHWFIPIIGFIYATGFLIVITFFDRFGIRESSGDFFKIKYLHVGILFLLLAILTIAPLYGAYLSSQFRKDCKCENTGNQVFKIYAPSVLLEANLLFVFYIVLVFAPTGYITQHEFIIPMMFFCTFIGISFIRQITKKLVDSQWFPEKHIENFESVGRWVLLLFIIIILDWSALEDISASLWEIFWSGKYVFLWFSTAIYIAERIRVRLKNIKDSRQRYTLKVMAVCLLIATYYLSVLTFAVRLYPYIPVAKGGGDYVDAPNVIMCFRETNTKFILPDLLSAPAPYECIKSRPLQIIEESATSVYVADPNDAGGAKEWRAGKKPKVYEVSKDKIGSISFQN